MPEERTYTVYKFDELSEHAKEHARDKAHHWACEDTDWTESVIEDAAQIADILGIDLRTRAAKLMGGGTRMEPCIYCSGFSSQGDGACFEGSYKYAKGASKKIRDHAPQDTELHKIADELQSIQRPHFYGLEANTRHSGHYSHSGCMQVSVNDAATGDTVSRDTEETLTDILRSFADWIYGMLEKEYEYQNSDEAIDDGIRANDYDFDEGGNIQ